MVVAVVREHVETRPPEHLGDGSFIHGEVTSELEEVAVVKS